MIKAKSHRQLYDDMAQNWPSRMEVDFATFVYRMKILATLEDAQIDLQDFMMLDLRWEVFLEDDDFYKNVMAKVRKLTRMGKKQIMQGGGIGRRTA